MNIFVLVAIVAMALVSCQKPGVDNVEPQEYEYTFLIGDADTKATVGENCVEWEVGDKVGTFNSKSNNKYSSVTAIEPATLSVYAPSDGNSAGLEENEVLHFYYPYASGDVEKTSVAMSIPTQQDGDDDMPMVSLPFTVTSATTEAQNEYAGVIKFANLGSVIEFNIYTDNVEYAEEIVKSVTFEADEALAGEFTFDLTQVDYSNEATLSINSVLTETAVVANASNDLVVGTKEEPAIVKMIVAPGTYAGNIVVKTNAATYTFPISNAKEFKRSTVKPLGLRLRADVRKENAAEELLVADGTYVIAVKESDIYYAVSSDANNSRRANVQLTGYSGTGDYVSHDSKIVWTITNVSNGITISAGELYWGATKSGISLVASGSASTISVSKSDTEGTYLLSGDCGGDDGIRYLAIYDVANGFGFYAESNKDDIYLIPATFVELPTLDAPVVAAELNETKDGINVSWNAIENAEKYVVTCGENSIEVTTTEHKFVGLNSGTYSITVTAVAENYNSATSAPVSVTVPAAGGNEGGEEKIMTLSNADIVSKTTVVSTISGSYKKYTITAGDGSIFNAGCIWGFHSNATKTNYYLQIKKGSDYYIQIPQLSGNIKKIVMTVSSSQKPMTGGQNTATLGFGASPVFNEAIATGTGSSSVQIDVTKEISTGYITAGGAVRVWDIEITYQ